MTPFRPSNLPHPRARDEAAAPAPDAELPGIDGVFGDVLVTVLLAAALAALVGAVLFLLWSALPAATAAAGVLGVR